jgi:signal transduction histidine kinase
MMPIRIEYKERTNMKWPFSKIAKNALDKVRRVAFLFSRIGTSPSDSSHTLKSVSLLNWFCLIVILSDAATVGHYIRLGMHAQTVAIGVIVGACLFTIYLNYLRFFQLARYVFLLFANFGFAFFSLTMGMETGVHLLYFVTPLLVFLISPREDKVTRIVWIAAPVLSMVLVVHGRDLVTPYLPTVTFPKEEYAQQMSQAITWTYIFVLSVAHHFDKVTKTREIELSRAIERISVAYGLVVHDASSYISSIKLSLFSINHRKMTQEELREVSALLTDNVDRLSELISKLREHLRRDQETEIGSSWSNLGEAFEDIVRLQKVRYMKVTDRIYKISSSAASTGVAFKKDDLVQLIDNLASNAVAAFPNSPGSNGIFYLDVAEVEVEGKKFTRIMVTDNGPGMSSEKLDKELSNGGKYDVRESFGLKFISRLVAIAGGSISSQTPADPDVKKLPDLALCCGNLPGTTITIDLPKGSTSEWPHLGSVKAA